MSKIIIHYNDETGTIEIDGSDGELSGIEILGILSMATNIIVHQDTRPITHEEQIQLEVITKQIKNKKYNA